MQVITSVIGSRDGVFIGRGNSHRCYFTTIDIMAFDFEDEFTDLLIGQQPVPELFEADFEIPDLGFEPLPLPLPLPMRCLTLRFPAKDLRIQVLKVHP